jgi:hypothetical protein
VELLSAKLNGKWHSAGQTSVSTDQKRSIQSIHNKEALSRLKSRVIWQVKRTCTVAEEPSHCNYLFAWALLPEGGGEGWKQGRPRDLASGKLTPRLWHFSDLQNALPIDYKRKQWMTL